MRSRFLKGVLCGILALGMTVCLTACADSDKEETAAGNVSGAEKASGVSNGELSSDSVVVSVGKTQVKYDEYRVYNWFLKNQYDNMLSTDVWNYNLGENTVGQNAIEDILRLIIQIKVMNKAAEGQQIVLGVDEKGDMDYKADQYLATIPPDVQEANGITGDILHRIFEENEVARKMYDVVTGGVQTNVDEKTMQAAKVLLAYFPADDTNREAVKAQADAVAAGLSGNKGNFYSYIKDKTGRAPTEEIIGKMDSRTNLVNAALALTKYSASGVVEESDGYYIMYCLKQNTKGLRRVYCEQYVAGQQNIAFQAAYENWAEKYEVKVSKSLLAN